MENGSNLLKKIKKITLITLFIIALYGVVCVPSIIVGYGAMGRLISEMLGDSLACNGAMECDYKTLKTNSLSKEYEI